MLIDEVKEEYNKMGDFFKLKHILIFKVISHIF